jgi:hypothetical protein
MGGHHLLAVPFIIYKKHGGTHPSSVLINRFQGSGEIVEKLYSEALAGRTFNKGDSPLRRLTRILWETGRNAEGVKGTLPLGCLPFWGREGVTLIAS